MAGETATQWILRERLPDGAERDVCIFFDEAEARADAALHGDAFSVAPYISPPTERALPFTTQIKRQTIAAKVIRADGTVEDLGIILDTNKDKKLLAQVRAAWREGWRRGMSERENALWPTGKS